MRRFIRALGAWCIFLALPFVGAAQIGPIAEQPDEADSDSSSTGSATKLPRWVSLGVEWRGRIESNTAFDLDSSAGVYLNRLRLNIAFHPRDWLRFGVQGQDARAFTLRGSLDTSDYQDAIDLRLAYIDLGHPEQGWQFRFGRQELAIGDERLIGADNYWDCFGQSFDAVRAGYIGASFHIDTFAGYLVQPGLPRIDPHNADRRISGMTIDFNIRGIALQPYFLWKRGGNTLDLSRHPGHRNVLTPGIRAVGDLPRHLNYNVELALQRGRVVEDGISAWAGHWELGWKPSRPGTGPRFGLEYNYASGDKDPGDGRHSTFDDLYPAGYNKCGTADPIAWRNIKYPALSVEMPLTRRWSIYASYRYFRLATTHDGLYPGGDTYVVRNSAATSNEVGSHALVSAGYSRHEHWRINAGYGYLFPGDYLRDAGFLKPLRTAYILTSLSF